MANKEMVYDFSNMSRFEAAGFLHRLILEDCQVNPDSVNVPETLENKMLIMKILSIKALAVAISCLLDGAKLDETEKEVSRAYISDGERLKEYLKDSKYEEILHEWKICS